jgi:CheY-like chemotaxis protein
MLSMINRKYLEMMGHLVVDSVTNGPDAIEAVKKHMPDIILMDLRLDGQMDGIETMLEISKFSNASAIYLTGNSDEENKSRAQQTNMLAFCVKPVHFEQLQQLLGKI